MSKITPSIVWALLLLVVSPLSGENPARRALQEKETLARIGDQPITIDAYLEELENRRAKAPARVLDVEGQRQVLEDMVRRRMLLAGASALGYADHPDVVEVWQQMMIKTYLRENLEQRLEKLEVSDAEVEAHYLEHAERYAVPARSQPAIVFYEIPRNAAPDQRSAARERAQSALGEAASLDPSILHFGEIARRDSSHRSSRYQGGVVGWLAHLPEVSSSLPRPVVDAVLRLEKAGDLGPLVEIPEGFYLIRLVDREPKRLQPLEQVAAGIRHGLLRTKRTAERGSFEEELRRQLEVHIDEGLFQSLDLPDDAGGPPAVPSAPLR